MGGLEVNRAAEPDGTSRTREGLVRACDLVKLFRLKSEARKLLRPEMTPQEYFECLMLHNHLAEARRLLAHALPPMRSIWWATLCLHHSLRFMSFATEQEESAFAAVLDWLRRPMEPERRAAEQAGWRAKPSTAAGILALSVYLSSGSMSRPGLPVVRPAAHLCGRLAGVVVYLASVRYDPAQYRHHLRQYLQIGVDVARGVNPPPVSAVFESPIEVPAAMVRGGSATLPEPWSELFRMGVVALDGVSAFEPLEEANG